MKNLKLDNTKTGRRIGFVFTVLILFFVAMLFVGISSDNNYSLMIQVISGVLVVMMSILFKFGGFDYLLIQKEEDDIEIKFYSVFPYGRKFRMIKINRLQVDKIEITNGFLGLNKSLTIYQKKKDGSAKYPKVCLSALNKDDFKSITTLFK